MALDDLTRNQWAKLASENLEKKDVESALGSMQMHYNQNYQGWENDETLGRAFNDAYVGLKSGNLTSRGLFETINNFSNAYDDALLDTNILDIVKESEYELPSESKRIMLKYGKNTLGEVIELLKDNRDDNELKTVVEAVKAVESYKLYAVLNTKMIEKMTDAKMAHLFPKEEREAA